MAGILGAITLILYLAVAWLLISKYCRTGDVGLILLGLPLVVLPIVSLPLTFWLQAGVDRLSYGEHVRVFPFTLVQQKRLTLGSFLTMVNLVEHVVWGVLALAAVYVLRPRRT